MNEQHYAIFLKNVKTHIHEAQYSALSAVNKALVQLYWQLGRLIAETQEEQKWGKAVVERLSKDLRADNPNTQGFSPPNLWNMRLFYLSYKDDPILQTLSIEIVWSQNVSIFKKCKALQERQFYMTATKKFGWTVRVLQHQIDNKTYEKYLLNQTNFDAVLPADYGHQAALGIIICRNKKRTIVEYSLKTSNAPIGVASYALVETLPDNYKNLLPSLEQISAKIDYFVENR
jgi:predicted nuclease of restriction endonuclease-like (RecB) superfamily